MKTFVAGAAFGVLLGVCGLSLMQWQWWALDLSFAAALVGGQYLVKGKS